MEPRVALVYVGTPESPAFPVMTPPLGVQLLATVLRSEGIDAEVFDDRLSDDVVGAVTAWGATVAGFSYLSPAARRATDLGRRCRSAGVVAVAGGPHATVLGGALVGNGFDHVVTGDGERALVDLVRRLATGSSVPPIVEGTPWGDLSDLPTIDRFDCYEPVFADAGRDQRTAPIQISRGCPMNCQFCELARDARVYALPNRFAPRSLARLDRDIDTFVERWDTNYLVVVDSIATLNDDLATGLLRSVASRPAMDVQLNAHVNRFSPRVERALVDLGPRASAWFGFESGSNAMLRRLKKGHDVDAALEAARRCAATGARLGVNILLGVPGETDADVAATQRFVDALLAAAPHPDRVMLNPNIFHPLPGTPLYRDCRDAGLVVDLEGNRIWTADEIRAEGRGPVRGVDYRSVLAAYDRYRPLEPAAAGAVRHRPWVDRSVP